MEVDNTPDAPPPNDFEKAWDWWIQRQAYRDFLRKRHGPNFVSKEDIDINFKQVLQWIDLEEEPETDLVDVPVSDETPEPEMVDRTVNIAMQGLSTLPVAVTEDLFMEHFCQLLAAEKCYGNFTFKKCKLWVNAKGDLITCYVFSGKCPIHGNDHGAYWEYMLHPEYESARWSCWLDNSQKATVGYHPKFLAGRHSKRGRNSSLAVNRRARAKKIAGKRNNATTEEK